MSRSGEQSGVVVCRDDCKHEEHEYIKIDSRRLPVVYRYVLLFIILNNVVYCIHAHTHLACGFDLDMGQILMH